MTHCSPALALAAAAVSRFRQTTAMCYIAGASLALLDRSSLYIVRNSHFNILGNCFGSISIIQFFFFDFSCFFFNCDESLGDTSLSQSRERADFADLIDCCLHFWPHLLD